MKDVKLALLVVWLIVSLGAGKLAAGYQRYSKRAEVIGSDTADPGNPFYF